MDGDLAGQVSLCFGEPVWSVRNPAHNRSPLLGAAATLQRRRVPLLLSTGAPLVLGHKLAGCQVDPIPPAGAITKVRRDTIPPLITRTPTRRGVLGLVGPVRLGQHARDLLVEPALAAVGVDGRVGPDLGSVDRDGAEPAQACSRGNHQHLREQAAERLLRLGAEPGDRGVVRAVLSGQDPERHIGAAHPLDLPRGPHALAVGIDQQPKQHPRVVPRRASPTTAPGPLQRGRIEFLDGLQHEPHQMIRRQPFAHVHWQQHRLITKHETIRLGHGP